MFNRLSKVLCTITVLAVAGAAFAQTPAKEKKVKDQAEYDLYKSATTTTDAAKRLGILDSWKEKYPDSDFKQERLLIYLTTYQALNQPAKMVETAKQILTLDPKEVKALYWLTVLTETQPPTPDSLATGEKAAQGLLSAEKPAAVDAAAWEKMKTSMLATAHKTLGFIAVQRKQPDVAEQEYRKALEADPTNASVSYSLGNAILAEKKPERQSEVLYHWARAASLTGPGALPEPLHTQINTFFTKQYTAFHGADDAGLKALRAQAVATPIPPADFKIENKNEIEAKGQEQFAKEHPELALWKAIKDQLTADNGQQYFETQLKGSAPPQMIGKLVSMKPAVNPKELVLAVSTPDTPEVTLKLETPLRGKADPGTELKFQGIPSAFTKDPFMVTFDVESKDKIEGWPAQAAPPVRKKSAPKKQ